MKLSWQQLDQITEKPKALTVLSSKETFFLKYMCDYIKQHVKDKRCVTNFVDKQFDWHQWMQEHLFTTQLFSTEAEWHFLDCQEHKLDKAAKQILADLAKHDLPHNIVLLLEQHSDKDKWLQAWDAYTLTFWPLQGTAFKQWLKQACQLYQLNISPQVLNQLAELSDNSPQLSLQCIEKLRTWPTPISTETIAQIMSVERSVQIFDLQDAIVRRDRSKALQYFAQLLQQKTPLALLNWLFKTEVLRLMQLKLSNKPESLLTPLGIHFSQKQLYLRNRKDWTEKKLTPLLDMTEKLERCVHGIQPQDAPELMRDLLIKLMVPQHA